MANFVERVRETISNAKSVIASCEGLLTEMGAPAHSARTARRRGRPPSVPGTATTSSPAAKVAMQDIPRLLAEQYPAGATYEQIRKLAGWKDTAPASNVQRLLVRQGKLTLTDGIYRAPATTPIERAA